MKNKVVSMVMTNDLSFDIVDLPKQFVLDVKKEMRFENPSYDKNIENEEPKYINLVELKQNILHIPRGSLSYLEYIFEKYDLGIDIIDKRIETKGIIFPAINFKLFSHQKRIIKKGLLLTQGTVESPCGSGKTISGIGLLILCAQKSLIIVPDNEILKQWIVRLHEATNIDLRRIGVLTSEEIIYNRFKFPHETKDITISTNASLYRRIDNKKFCDQFGFVFLDEAHLVGARTFREVMDSFAAKYRYGFTATLFRNDCLSDLIQIYCGNKFLTVTDENLIEEGLLIKPTLFVVKSQFYYLYNYKYRTAYNYLLQKMQTDIKRNNLIIDIIVDEFDEKRMVLVVAKRVEHCKILHDLLRRKNRSIRVGFMAGTAYDEKTAENARRGKVDVIFSVDRAKMGLDIKPLETVLLVAPRKAQNEMEQIIGRVARPDCCFGKYKNPRDKIAKIIDIVDVRVETISGGKIMISSFKERLNAYNEKCFVDNEEVKKCLTSKK